MSRFQAVAPTLALEAMTFVIVNEADAWLILALHRITPPQGIQIQVLSLATY